MGNSHDHLVLVNYGKKLGSTAQQRIDQEQQRKKSMTEQTEIQQAEIQQAGVQHVEEKKCCPVRVSVQLQLIASYNATQAAPDTIQLGLDVLSTTMPLSSKDNGLVAAPLVHLIKYLTDVSREYTVLTDKSPAEYTDDVIDAVIEHSYKVLHEGMSEQDTELFDSVVGLSASGLTTSDGHIRAIVCLEFPYGALFASLDQGDDTRQRADSSTLSKVAERTGITIAYGASVPGDAISQAYDILATLACDYSKIIDGEVVVYDVLGETKDG